MPETSWGEETGKKQRWSGVRTGSAFYWAMMVALLVHLVGIYFMSFMKTGGQAEEYVVTQAKLVHVEKMEDLKPLVEEEMERPDLQEQTEPRVQDPLQAVEAGPVDVAPQPSDVAPTDLTSDIVSGMQDRMASVDSAGTRQIITGRLTKQERETMIQKFGSGQAVRQIEGGVDEGLAFLAKQQEPDGGWTAGDAGKNPGITGLCLLCFATGGFPPGAYGMRENAARAANYLLSKSVAEGPRQGQIASQQHEMYSHAIATLALCETYSRVEDEEWKGKLKPAIEGAIAFLLKAQNTEKKPKEFNGPVDPKAPEYGGWRYTADSREGDLSVTGWCMMALAAGRGIGVPVPNGHIERGLRYVARCYTGQGFAYMPGGGTEPGMTAIGLLCLEMFGLRDNEMAQRSAQFIMTHKPDWNWGGRAFYYWYYATQGAFHFSPGAWDAWRPDITRVLLENQKDDGSWGTALMNANERMLNEPQRAYATAMAVLSLQIYYRHFPVYLRG